MAFTYFMGITFHISKGVDGACRLLRFLQFWQEKNEHLIENWGMKLTTHLHLLPKLRMYGAILPLLQYIFMVQWDDA
jgi:hypothetical protein